MSDTNLDLRIAQTKIAEAIIAGDSSTVLTNLGDDWRGSLPAMQDIQATVLRARAELVSAGALIERAKLEALAEGATEGEVQTIVRGLIDGIKGSVNDETSRLLTLW